MAGRSSETLSLIMEVHFDDRADAERIAAALRVDDDEFVTTTAEGDRVIAEIIGDSVLSLKRSADDWMACLMAAVRTTDRYEL